MKDQYFGDINDYRKYGLLRVIQSTSDCRLLVCWMLTPDDGSTDGEKTSYLSEPEKYESFDPELFKGLKKALASGVSQSVVQFESAGLIPRAHYFSEAVPDDREARGSWFKDLLGAAVGCELVFLDPDNGFEIQSKRMGRKGSSKFLYWSEVQRLWGAGHSLLIYQHFPRRPRDEFVFEVEQKLKGETGAALVKSIKTSTVVFFLAVQEGHVASFRTAIAALEHEWPGQLELVVR